MIRTRKKQKNSGNNFLMGRNHYQKKIRMKKVGSRLNLNYPVKGL